MFLWHKDTFLWHKDTFSWQKVFFLWHKLFSNYLQYVTNQLPLRLLIVLKLTSKTSETPHKTLKDQWSLLKLLFFEKVFPPKVAHLSFFLLVMERSWSRHLCLTFLWGRWRKTDQNFGTAWAKKHCLSVFVHVWILVFR